jgi:hypothetical protein
VITGKNFTVNRVSSEQKVFTHSAPPQSKDSYIMLTPVLATPLLIDGGLHADHFEDGRPSVWDV